MHIYRTGFSGVSLASGTAKTLVQLVTPATRRAKIIEISFSAASVTATDPAVLLELLIQTTAGTSSAGTIALMDQADPAALCSTVVSVTAEPTGTTPAGAGPFYTTPVGGLLVYQSPQGFELEMLVSTRVGLRATAGSALTSNVGGYIIWQE